MISWSNFSTPTRDGGGTMGGMAALGCIYNFRAYFRGYEKDFRSSDCSVKRFSTCGGRCGAEETGSRSAHRILPILPKNNGGIPYNIL